MLTKGATLGGEGCPAATTQRADTERARLAALYACLVLDTPPEPAFDAPTRLLARALDVPMAAISFIDRERVWIKSAVGPFPVAAGSSGTDMFCLRALLNPDQLLVVLDASTDARFRDHPYVTGAQHLRFYAGAPLRDENGHVLGVLCAADTRTRSFGTEARQTLVDLAAIVVSTLSLRNAARKYGNALALGPHRSWLADAEGNALEVWDRATGLIGLPPGRPDDPALLLRIHPDDRDETVECWRRSLAGGMPYDREQRLRLPDGSYRWFRVYAAPERDAAGHILRWHGLSEDIHERRLSQARVEYLAYHDELTGLSNRVHFRQMLEKRVAAADPDAPFALLRIDLDDFKAINDTLGHNSGDLLLTEVGERICTCVAPADMVAREGGDEFFVLLGGGAQCAQVALVVDAILDALLEPMKIDGSSLSLSAAIGVTLCPRDGTNVDTLLQNADLALSRAKREGRGSCRFFEPGMDERLRTRQALKVDLRSALERNELTLAYQPLVGVRSGCIHGFEALLRWSHPTRGAVSPIEFIPAAESGGQILPIGQWVLEQACRAATAWPEPLRVAVNLSVMQFRQRTLPQVVAAALSASGLAPGRLELEITESVPLLDDEASVDMLHQLRGLGVRIALDDFGTGYASLGYLQRFPFDKLKIERSFIARMLETTDARTIIQAVLRMSQALGIAVTAEGVETREQFDFLKNEGCDELQGYFFSSAVPAADIPDMLTGLDARRQQEGWLSGLVQAV